MDTQLVADQMLVQIGKQNPDQEREPLDGLGRVQTNSLMAEEAARAQRTAAEI